MSSTSIKSKNNSLNSPQNEMKPHPKPRGPKRNRKEFNTAGKETSKYVTGAEQSREGQSQKKKNLANTRRSISLELG
ncbi:uncharacterized protein Dana_GF27998 [Drosophila ananassae]|uniref:Uncharacterized protein n=1 Tax=Drosophila ananassae TaxID=7217 RepID=A0A0P8XUQ1_DROAN|nr:uncharacterized protein Dana_GF27998 [Drosophila ananassae]